MPERAGTDERAVGKTGSVKGDNEAANRRDKLVVKLPGKEKEQHVIGEDGNNEGVYVMDSIGKRQLTDNITMGREPLQGLVHGLGKDITEGDVTADGDPEVDGVRPEGQIGPGTSTQGLGSVGVSLGALGADDTTLVPVDT